VRITPSIADLDHAFQMLMDILRKPSLGHYVRHIEYRQTNSRYRLYEVKPYEQKLDPEDMRQLRSATRRGRIYGSSTRARTEFLVAGIGGGRSSLRLFSVR
jgi:SNF2 family DNA or RNA helicase